MSIVVAQLGARMHYAVPRIFSEAALLERFYTDICANKDWVRGLHLLPRGLRPGGVQRLLGRRPVGVPAGSITAFTGFGLKYAREIARSKNAEERTAAYLAGGKEFCRRVVARGFGKGKAVYAFNSAALEIFEVARAAGVRTILEQTIAPSAIEQEILAEEARLHPGWEAPTERNAVLDEYSRREEREWTLADVIVCGSKFVREGIIARGGPEARCVVVPYGIEAGDETTRQSVRQPGPLRVLVVGAVGLRKGSPCVLEAAKQMGPRAQFRMAGAIRVLPGAEKQLREHVQLAGIVPRLEMHAQYAWADVFLLPSLCEGSATVTYEARREGMPVVCTRSTGSTVRDGLDGFIVPERDAGAIVAKLDLLASKVGLLESMSESARQNSAEYTLEKYGARLLTALRGAGVCA